MRAPLPCPPPQEDAARLATGAPGLGGDFERQYYIQDVSENKKVVEDISHHGSIMY